MHNPSEITLFLIAEKVKHHSEILAQGCYINDVEERHIEAVSLVSTVHN